VFKRRKPDEPSPPEPPPAAAPKPEQAKPDSGVGVPPFRPTQGVTPAAATTPVAAPVTAPDKEPLPMGRAPFAPNQPASPPVPQMPPPPRPGMAGTPGPAVTPAMGPNADLSARPRVQPSERRTLVVGRGISVQGVVQDAERLVVEGTVEATMIHATELSISPGGVFKGEVEVEDAEVAGTIDGTLTARGNLIVRATGRLLGTARYRRLQVEDGGQITGRMEMVTETARTPEGMKAVETAS